MVEIRINAKTQYLTHSRPPVIGISNYYQTVEFILNHSGISQNNICKGTATMEWTRDDQRPTGTVETGTGGNLVTSRGVTEDSPFTATLHKLFAGLLYLRQALRLLPCHLSW